MMNKTILFQINASHFCAGGVIENRLIINAAPIIKYMIGWNVEKAYYFCIKRKWNIKSYND